MPAAATLALLASVLLTAPATSGTPVGTASVTSTTTTATPPPSPLLTLPPSILESSGLATSATQADVLFTHEDSGAPAQFEAVATDGRLVATYRLPGVQARDWEDMATGTDEQGRPVLYLADIGDNDAARTGGVLVHRVLEPQVDTQRTGQRLSTERPVSYRLVYADGPHDAETLLVEPRTRRVYVVTKPLLGTPGLYAAPPQLSATAPNRLTRVADVAVRRTGTPGGPGIGGVANLLVTAGDISPDGSRLAVRTYTDLYEWRVPDDGDLAAAVRTGPVVTPLPEERQGEGLAYSADGRSLLTSSEGSGAPVHRVPSALTAATRPSTGEPVASGTPTPPGPGVTGPTAAPRPSSHTAARTGVVVATAAVLVLAGLALAARRRRSGVRARGSTPRR